MAVPEFEQNYYSLSWERNITNGKLFHPPKAIKKILAPDHFFLYCGPHCWAVQYRGQGDLVTCDRDLGSSFQHWFLSVPFWSTVSGNGVWFLAGSFPLFHTWSYPGQLDIRVPHPGLCWGLQIKLSTKILIGAATPYSVLSRNNSFKRLIQILWSVLGRQTW